MKSIAIEWHQDKPQGLIEVTHGRLVSLAIVRGKGNVKEAYFTFTSIGSCRLEVTIAEERLSPAAHPTFVAFRTSDNPFTVLLRDVNSRYPIWIPAYGVVVTEASDARSYEQIVDEISSKGLQTALEQIATEPEEDYETAATATHRLYAPTWLGLSRDIRIFEMEADLGSWAGFSISPRFHGENVTLPETGEQPVQYYFMCGRGTGCVRKLSRRLEDGVLPILHAMLADGDLRYLLVAFVNLERRPLTAETLRGTHFLVADRHGLGHMFTPEQEVQCEALLSKEMNRDEETVLYCRIQALNTGQVPRYAWFEAPASPAAYQYDEHGFGRFGEERVFAVAKCNGSPLPKKEVAVLVAPGATATFEFAIPHRPISAARAARLAEQDFTSRHAECRAFWRRKLATAASLTLPEPRIKEMAQAGLLHLDLIAYGLEPDQPVVPCIGIYNTIGTEGAPIIQFMDSMGWHDLARRCLNYFLEKQHEDGFMQNFGGYMLETGAVLWSLGEHYRYTRDIEWLKQIKPKLLKACDFIARWRERNLKEELRGKGYGLMEGKVADPEDPYRCYMLNGYAYLGLSRAAEMLAEIDSIASERIGEVVEALRADLRTAVFESMAKSPVVPLGDGSWCPSAGPWAEARGPVALLTDANSWATHGSILVRDSIIGPLYVAFCDVLEPNETATDWLMAYHSDLMHVRNTALSQPYYSPHPLVHLKRGEVKAFLKAYYNGFAGLADRETYTFWEHYFHASPHKTHEEGWFLMQTRWMLYLEAGDTLRLLPGIPRAWMEHGQRLELKNVASYFGKVSLQVESQIQQDRITAVVECASDRKPATVELRLPHPQGQRAIRAAGGAYDPVSETVRIEPFTGRAEVTLEFG